MRVGRYALYDEIGAGGMATVHLGRMYGAGGFSRVVAIKRMLPQFARDAEFIDMFVDEGRLASRISHPNVVTILDVVRAEEELFIVMDYLPGETLAKLLASAKERGEPIPPAIAAGIVHGVLAGLDAAHEATAEDGAPLDIVHRDVSPDNVIVGVDGIARLVDFGVATARERLHTTRDGIVKGKLRYLPPEAFDGDTLTRSADIYAAAVVLWEVLVGRKLFMGESEAQTLGRILEGRVRPPSEVMTRLPPALDDIVLRGLARNRGDRYTTARQFARDLRGAVEIAHPDEVAEWLGTVAPGVSSRHRKAIRQVESGRAPIVLDVMPVAGKPHGVTHVVQRSSATRRTSSRHWRRVAIGAALVAVLAIVAGVSAQQGPSVSVAESMAATVPRVSALPATSTTTRDSPPKTIGSAKRESPPMNPVIRPKPPCSTLKFKDADGIWRVKRECIDSSP